MHAQSAKWAWERRIASNLDEAPTICDFTPFEFLETFNYQQTWLPIYR
jgi:hypothetical protein